MDARAPLTLEEELAAVTEWWREAGVDYAFGDDPRNWLADAAAPAAPAALPGPAMQAKPETPRIGGARSGWPATLGAFDSWWLGDATLELGGLGPRLAPRGPGKAPLMIVVGDPEADDRDRLLSGPQGKFLGAMLHAMDVPADRVRVASALPRHTPLPDWTALAAAGLGEILQRHIALAAPERVILFGRNILPLVGHDPAQPLTHLREIHHEGGMVPALAAAGLAALCDRAGLRARFWQRWLDWTDTTT